MTARAILLGGRGAAEGLRDALLDYTAAGLLEEFVWVPLSQAGPDPRCLVVARGGVRTARLVDVVADGLAEPARFASISALLPRSEVPSAAAVNAVARLLPLGVASRYRVLVTGSDGVPSDADGADVAVGGWHNVLLSPEDSDTPGAGQVLLGGDPSPAEVGRVLAPRLAALLGLWVGQDVAPLDDEQPSPGPQLRFFRSFTRFLDGEDLERELRTAVLPAPGRLSLPMIGGHPAQEVPDPRAAATDMAERIWKRHGRVLEGRRSDVRPPRPEQRSWQRSLSLFLSFVWAALRNAPGAWLGTVKARMASSAAGALHDVVYGAGSAYTVVVAGRLPDGRPAQWEELADAVGSLSAALTTSGHLPQQPAPDALGDLWRDFANGALTLGDAGRRDAALPPVTVGSSLGIVADPGAIVPDPQDEFPLASGSIEARLGFGAVPAADVLAARRLRSDLEQLETTDVAIEAAQVRARLEAWFPRRASAFSTAFAKPLVQRLTAVTDEIRGLLAALARLSGAAAVGLDETRHQTRLGRQVLLAGGIGLALTVLGHVLVDRFVESAWAPWAVVVALLLSTVATMLAMFAAGQAELFRALNALESAQSDLERTRADLGLAITHHRQLVSAYRQFRSWSVVLGEVLARPFGSSQEEERPGTSAVEGLPRSVRRGTAGGSAATVGDVSVDLRRRHLQQGWLTGSLAAVQDDGVAHLGPEAQHLRGTVEPMFTASGLAYLEPWTALVRRDGVGRSPAARLWADVQEEFGTSPARSRDVIVETVDDHGRRETLTSFLGVLTSSTVPQPFPQSVLVPSARVGTALTPERPIVTMAGHGLSSWVTVCELSDGFAGWELAKQGATAPVAGAPRGVTQLEGGGEAAPPGRPRADIDDWTY